MAETEAIGVSVLDTMHQQGESLLSSTKKARTCLSLPQGGGGGGGGV